MTARVDLAVIGGGISGLAAAWEGRRRGASVTVLEAGPRAGGKLQTSRLGGVDLDESADAFLARVPEAVDLCAELGIDTDLVSPGSGSAYVWLGGALRRLPAEQLLGVPTDLDALAGTGLLSAAGIERARQDLTLPDDRPSGGTDGHGKDESVGDLVRRRLGDEVLDRLVAPLVGSVYAGDCDRLSLQITAAQLAAARDRDPSDPSLVRAAAAIRSQGVDTGLPVFLAPRGGVGRLADALADALGDDVRTGTTVTGLTPDGNRWRVSAGGSDDAVGNLAADAVVLATPAFVSAPLLAPVAPGPAAFLAGIDHASVALLGLAVPRDGIDHPMDGSGFLVPRSEGLVLTACSWATTKWPHLAVDPSMALLRASAGHDGDDRGLALPDHELVAAMLANLRTTMGLRADPVDVRITRWPRSFPQPRPGHLAAVAAAEAALAAVSPRLAITGAWARGVGIPACIRGARAAAARALGGTNGR
ncbi:MAG TPA: protoporphyrinogen oxidase [Acidimicrobiales bacterium]|nr:protoporphyrinogen oxidase [Acidimicrobiales bacterium]